MLTLVPIYPHGVFFEPGHMTSIEPGFYKEKEWGIRTESVFVCKSVDVSAEARALSARDEAKSMVGSADA
jgi:Xaa-Pro aminopeptidase